MKRVPMNEEQWGKLWDAVRDVHCSPLLRSAVDEAAALYEAGYEVLEMPISESDRLIPGVAALAA